MNVEQVVEEFSKLVSEERVEQAKNLVVEEAKGREDELAGWLLGVGAEIGDKGNLLMALFCFKAAEEIVVSKDIQEKILECIGIFNNNYAILLEEKKDFEKAEHHYKKALKINPEYAEAHYNYAILLKEKKDFEKAEHHYKKALKINPEYADAHGNLGILYSDQKKYSKAVKHFEKASKIFKKEKRSFDYKKAEAFKFSAQAKLLWQHESWEKIQTNLEKAIKNFAECGMDYHAGISSNFLVLVAVDQSFNESLTSQTLISLRDNISSVYQNILKFKENLEEDIYEYQIFNAKLICIGILYKALTSTHFDIQNLDEARKTLRKEKFIQAVQSVNCLENFVIDLSESLSQYGDIESIPESEEKTLLTNLNPLQSLDGYTSAGVIQEVQKFEPWEKSQTPIQYTRLNPPAKKWVRLGIVQFNFTLQSKNGTPQFPPTPENPLVLKDKFLQYLDIAIKKGLDIVCFPELSMTHKILEIIQEKNIPDMIIIGGSCYKNKKNICPVICNNTIYPVQKIHPSKYCQFSSIEGKGMDPGDTIYLFDSVAGKFVVLICEDFRDELHTILSRIDDLDLLFVTSYNPNPDRFHEIAAPIPPDHPMYIIQSNVSEINEKFGKSSLFGNIDLAYAEQLKKEGFNSDIEKNKVAELKNEGILIAEVNTTQKAISKVTPVDYQTIKNVKIITNI
ncbi:MAG: tetratricopeptide repeat protein [Candidatus Methanofastidiosia archaeon]